MSENPRTDEKPPVSQLKPEEAKKAIQLLSIRAGVTPEITSRAIDLGQYLTWIAQITDDIDKKEVEEIREKLSPLLKELANDTSVHTVNLALWIILTSSERTLRRPITDHSEDPMFQ